jgi:hypothetical protein
MVPLEYFADLPLHRLVHSVLPALYRRRCSRTLLLLPCSLGAYCFDLSSSPLHPTVFRRSGGTILGEPQDPHPRFFLDLIFFFWLCIKKRERKLRGPVKSYSQSPMRIPPAHKISSPCYRETSWSMKSSRHVLRETSWHIEYSHHRQAFITPSILTPP